MLLLESRNASRIYEDEHVAFDFDRASMWVDARHVILTKKEHQLLALLAANIGEIVPRSILLERIWGYGKDIRTRTLDVHIRRLRKKLFPYGDTYIETIFGVGYRFQGYRKPRNLLVYTPEMIVA